MLLHSSNFPYDVVGNDSAYFLNKVTLFCDVSTCALFPRVFSFVDNCVFPCGCVLLMSGWICQRKPFWITSKNGYVLVMIPKVTLWKIPLRQFLRLMSQRLYVVQKTKIVPLSTNRLWTHLQHRMGQPDAPSWELQRRSLPKRRCNFLHPKQPSPFQSPLAKTVTRRG